MTMDINSTRVLELTRPHFPALVNWPAQADEQPRSVLVISLCRDPLLWYANLVGTMVPFDGIWPEAYRSREPAGYCNIVHFGDAVPALYTPAGMVIPLRCGRGGQHG